MCDVLTADLLRQIICDFASTMQQHAAYLTELDRLIGDGDHGWNMATGFRKVREQLENLPPTNPALLLRTCGMTLVTTISGASGPLYGAAFIAAGMAASGKSQLSLADLAQLFQAANEAIARRGRCRLGDKTLLDAFQPAAEALQQAAIENCTLLKGLELATEAARHGMLSTIPQVARRGLAIQFGAASIGQQDPGATSCYLLFDSMLQTYRRVCN